MTEHTALPWKWDKINKERLVGKDRNVLIHNAAWDIDAHDARFIVTACNNHADLLEALKITLEALQAWRPLFKDDWDFGDDNAVDVAEQAIRKYEETQ